VLSLQKWSLISCDMAQTKTLQYKLFTSVYIVQYIISWCKEVMPKLLPKFFVVWGGGWARFGGLCPPGPNVEPPLTSTPANVCDFHSLCLYKVQCRSCCRMPAEMNRMNLWSKWLTYSPFLPYVLCTEPWDVSLSDLQRLLWQTIPRVTWIKSINSVRSGNGCTSR